MDLMTRSVDVRATPVNRRRSRKGLTLMELVVVLSILAALAAIVIPIFPNLLRRAHKATDCTQTNEMAKSVQLFNALYFSYPDGFDTLVDTTGAIPAYIPGASTTPPSPFGNFTAPHDLTTDEVAALQSVGINKLKNIGTTADRDASLVAGYAGPFHPTMWPYPDTATKPAAIAVGTHVLILNRNATTGTVDGNPRFLANVLTTEAPTANFMVVGVGPWCAMVGKNIQDAPTSVPQKSDFTPDNTYSRVGLIFQISGAAVTAGDGRAIFVCACALEDDELESTEKDIIGYHQVTRDPRLP